MTLLMPHFLKIQLIILFLTKFRFSPFLLLAHLVTLWWMLQYTFLLLRTLVLHLHSNFIQRCMLEDKDSLSTGTHDQVPAGSTSSNSLNIPSTSLSNTFFNIFIPTTFEEASKHAGWMTTMREEMDALACNNTWVLTSLPEGKI